MLSPKYAIAVLVISAASGVAANIIYARFLRRVEDRIVEEHQN